MALDSVSQLGKTIGNISNTTNDTKAAVNPDEVEAQTFRVFNENIAIEQGPLIGLTRNVLSSTLWGAFNWNEKSWNDSYSQGFILGNTLAGELGTNALGDPGTDQEIGIVHNEDGLFYEHFNFDTLIDTTISTATVSTSAGTVSFSDSVEQELYSKIVAKETLADTLEVQNVRVTLTGTGTEYAEIFVKTDDNDLQEVLPDTKTTLTNPGSALYYKIDNGLTTGLGFPTAFGTWGDYIIGAMVLTDIQIQYEVS